MKRKRPSGSRGRELDEGGKNESRPLLLAKLQMDFSEGGVGTLALAPSYMG